MASKNAHVTSIHTQVRSDMDINDDLVVIVQTSRDAQYIGLYLSYRQHNIIIIMRTM